MCQGASIRKKVLPPQRKYPYCFSAGARLRWTRRRMFPYRDENETQRPAIVTGAIIGVNVLVWLFVQGAGAEAPLARSVCELGLIPGELTGAVPPGTTFPMGEAIACATDPG